METPYAVTAHSMWLLMTASYWQNSTWNVMSFFVRIKPNLIRNCKCGLHDFSTTVIIYSLILSTRNGNLKIRSKTKLREQLSRMREGEGRGGGRGGGRGLSRISTPFLIKWLSEECANVMSASICVHKTVSMHFPDKNSFPFSFSFKQAL